MVPCRLGAHTGSPLPAQAQLRDDLRIPTPTYMVHSTLLTECLFVCRLSSMGTVDVLLRLAVAASWLVEGASGVHLPRWLLCRLVFEEGIRPRLGAASRLAESAAALRCGGRVPASQSAGFGPTGNSSSRASAQAHLSRSKASAAVVGSLKPVCGVNLALSALLS